MLSEINAMPEAAQTFLNQSEDYALPAGVPYIGMGSSYFAPLALKYMGYDLQPEMASEFYNYQSPGKKHANGVLLSQSGRSSEVLWCTSLFEKFTAISNTIDSPLCTAPQALKTVALLAGEEKFSSSKTYINSLLALLKGFGVNPQHAVNLLATNLETYKARGKQMADAVYERWKEKRLNGLYITGSGPNIGTALQAALIMSECSKLNFNGMAMAQYDHGTKETAKDSVVIQILSKGKSYSRGKSLSKTITAAGARVFEVEEQEASENESVLHNIVPFNFMAYYLSTALQITDTFMVGGKVTEVSAH